MDSFSGLGATRGGSPDALSRPQFACVPEQNVMSEWLKSLNILPQRGQPIRRPVDDHSGNGMVRLPTRAGGR